ncbi:hypothetical protein GGI25_003132 [Coemansia spiralis]|uniref:Piwi domain-containing protein n=2 Tax=Coemansia TaxID=4863 RepID=A0A9W8G7A9_9FUNG|nr:Piwi domain-containing protein [Coemansia spiralis]KAJ1991752.1 hypothetical protein EDC05_003249 [Coemansia umbellata]KAJ2621743.1 hypothetical protein GGI26_003838 [Coemansia sp. RSA 1358]KAJ2677497.1 hypothetical protein GGI25_003132 [Coemansia spiralis]
MDDEDYILRYPPQPSEASNNASSIQNVSVLSNHCRIRSIKAKHIYVYFVGIQNLDAKDSIQDENSKDDTALDGVSDTQLRKDVFTKAVVSNDDLKSKKLHFDGQSYAYSAKSIHKNWHSVGNQSGSEGKSEYKTTVGHMSAQDHASLPCQFQVVLRAQRRYDLELLDRYCKGDNSVPETYIQGLLYALENIIRGFDSSDFVTVENKRLSIYSALIPNDGNECELYWEYRFTLRPGRGGLLVNIIPKSVPVTSTDTVESLAYIHFKLKVSKETPREKTLEDHVGTKDWLAFELAIRNLDVSILGSNSEVVHRIVRLSKEPAGELEFDNMPLAEYLQHKYGISATKYDTKLPCAMTADGMPIPLAICAIIGKKVVGRLANWQQSKLRSLCIVNPTKRHKLFEHGAQVLANSNSTVFSTFGIEVDPELVCINAQVLEKPRLLMSKPTKIHDGSAEMKPVRLSVDGNWELKGRRVLDGRQLISWAVVVFGCSKQSLPSERIQAFIMQLVKICKELGIDVHNTGPPIKYAALSSGDIQLVMTEASQMATAATRSDMPAQLIFCILPKHNVQIYGELKRVALTLLGVQTQCIVANNVRAHNPKLLSQIALKMNVKLGGVTGELHADDAPCLAEEPTLVIASDVCHSTEAGGMSVAAVLGSTDMLARRFQGTVIQHPKGLEYIENLDVIIRQALRLFYKNTGKKPTRIVYYRDGVNDSQMRDVKKLELPAIYKGCRLIDSEYCPKVTLILARKRHTTRFIRGSHGSDASAKLGLHNCLSGTTINDVVASPVIFSFYLVAHKAQVGVTKPMYYLVLHDDNNFDPYRLKTLTYSLCYTYPIYNRPAMLPSALYYAHRLSGKGRLQLSQRFDNLPAFNKLKTKTGTKRKQEQPPPYLVPLHKRLQDTMYFM